MVKVAPEVDEGLTVIELMVAMALLLVGLSMFVTVLFAVQQTSARQLELGRANDQARLALQEIDRQVRSGYVASMTPIPGADASARIYTEARMRGDTDKPQCVAWVLFGEGSGPQTLYSRSWPAGTAAPSSFSPTAGWNVIATDIVNTTNGDGDSQTFDLVKTDVKKPLGGTDVSIGQSLTITLWVNPSSTRASQVTKVSTTVTSRNVLRATANAEGGGLGARNSLCG